MHPNGHGSACAAESSCDLVAHDALFATEESQQLPKSCEPQGYCLPQSEENPGCTTSTNSINELRGHLFDVLRNLKSAPKENAINPETADAICLVSKRLIETAKLELEYRKMSGREYQASEFLGLDKVVALPTAKKRPVYDADTGEVFREDVLTQIQQVYPAGMYRNSNWILCERRLRQLVDIGESEDALLAAAELYGKQQKTLGNVGTQWILGPDKFYGANREGLDHWRGPFPLPRETPNVEAEKMWPKVRAAITDADLRKELSEKVMRVVGEIGGFHNLGQTNYSQMDFVRTRFIQAYMRAV
jgi:hypothetical protein